MPIGEVFSGDLGVGGECILLPTFGWLTYAESLTRYSLF